ncbi:TetR/AcrR family transcriptional regulator [Tianweitania sediminis]|uniref:TetR/AcrR family transcriptional regulator n=1 Tax=Tianweitania sediminis TaxID=1502156 RepID=A0A8J7UI94_9HYPH|nr:TetR/AcrR family transcriptional regulator [Tianweitania sediminis]MBP0440029.1 TetR/AcrR family transcriptional regulator [Tianweitania sediminis]
MGPEPQKQKRKVRADAARNRALLLEAATVIFSQGGPQASLEDVARQAGVGIGTLYRHFPARQDLFEAVYRHEVDQLGLLAEKLAQTPGPVEALRSWLHASVRLVATKKGMVEALQLVAHGPTELTAYSLQRMTGAIALLLSRGIEAGVLRDDIFAEDLWRTIIGIYNAQPKGNWQPLAIKMVDVLVDGLRRS